MEGQKIKNQYKLLISVVHMVSESLVKFMLFFFFLHMISIQLQFLLELKVFSFILWWQLIFAFSFTLSYYFFFVLVDSETTKNVLIASTYISLKCDKYAKYTSELSTLCPRILLSGPAGKTSICNLWDPNV